MIQVKFFYFLTQSFFDEQPFGHISDLTDDDGIIRHSNLFLIYDSVFVPSLAFATYLSLMYSDQPSMKITLQKNFIGNNAFFQIQKDSLFIPLDDEGKTLIPFVAKWGEDFDLITVENFFQTIKSENGFNKLKEYFNGKIVIIGDVSTGSSDLRSTPMDQVAPLIMLHSAMLNSLINKSFLKKINLNIFLIIINVCFILLYLSQIVKVKNLFSVVFITLIFLELIGSIILIILGFVIPFFSLLICNVIYFTFGFLNLQFIINKERKILEIDYLRKSYEMSETRKIQNSLLPKVPYNLDGYDIGFMIQTAEEVGGDFYDIFNEDDCLTLFIADGSGHGLQAGTLVIFLKTILTSTRDYKDPKLLFHKINNTLCSIKLNKLFLCLTMIKIKKDYVEYITAGMPPILHYKFSEKKVYQYRNKNLSLGLKKDFSFVSDTIKVDSGDLLFLASDGLYELFNHKKEMLEIERVSQFIYNNAKLNSNEIVNNLKLFISNWIGKQAQADDISSVIIKKIS
ncbi:SpoIIE family protein phosphatase [Ignavibacterium sp.]|uniref:SpoIIE family protein phosphatase n=1 Tax=Ignavibacterium sp. TaxID=2651167 RepID=UPI00307FB079